MSRFLPPSSTRIVASTQDAGSPNTSSSRTPRPQLPAGCGGRNSERTLSALAQAVPEATVSFRRLEDSWRRILVSDRDLIGARRREGRRGGGE